MSNNCIGDVQWIVVDAPSVNMSTNNCVVRTHRVEIELPKLIRSSSRSKSTR